MTSRPRQTPLVSSFGSFAISWLDFKLGFRMLRRYPGLTLAGGFAMAFAIWVGAGAFEIITQFVRPNLGFPHGDRLVALRIWNAATRQPEPRALHELAAWREQLKSVQMLGAWRAIERNLTVGAETRGEPVAVVETSASAFRVTEIPALLGRTLVLADEARDAPAVAVIGHDLWQARFAGDPGVVGRTIRLGAVQTTIVGVMPKGFGFPIFHELWTPLRLDVLAYEPGKGPRLAGIFGRLSPDASLDAAQAELTAIGLRRGPAVTDAERQLRPQVMPYTKSIFDLSGTESAAIMSTNLFLIMLLVLVCGNVALLMFARAASREAEITVRNALGAGRGRIVAQFFAEALVLGSVAAVIGLAFTQLGLRWVYAVIDGPMAQLPFWFQPRLSPMTLIYAAFLTVLGALIAGVIPALKVTRGLRGRLSALGAGGGGLKFGGVWTAVIVTQVALTVTFPVAAFFTQRDSNDIRAMDIGVPPTEYLMARLAVDATGPDGTPLDTTNAALAARARATRQELRQRLESDPSVMSVTFAERLPFMYHPHRIIELDAGESAPRRPQWPQGYRVTNSHVDADYFRTFDAAPLSGRTLHAGDIDASAAPRADSSFGGSVVVNQSFVRLVMGGRNPIGRRLRYVSREESNDRPGDGRTEPWFEIVGVVRDLGTAVGADVGQQEGGDPKVAGIYHALSPSANPVHVAVRVRASGGAAEFTTRLREEAAATDPSLRVYEPRALDRLMDAELNFLSFWFRLILGVSTMALFLSLAAIYAVMSFTVARRTREIGIRVALGSDRKRIILTIFRKPLTQVGFGILAGGVLITLLSVAIEGSVGVTEALTLASYAVMTTVVCMLACIVPIRRALSVEPTEALRAEG